VSDLVFVTAAAPGPTARRAALLASGLRRFGGRRSADPVWVMVPDHDAGYAPEETSRFREAGIRTVPFPLDPAEVALPFGTKVAAAAAAESHAGGTTGTLVWLDPDTLILSDPGEFVLSPGEALAYRPVHHRLIGPGPDGTLDPFWDLVFRFCGADPENRFPMITHVGEPIGPYFNAGSFAVDPGRGLLRIWRDRFRQACADPEFSDWLERDALYAVFLHQAIWTGILLAELDRREMRELNPGINYPLHLHHEVPPERRPGRIDELTTVRYEDLLESPGWRDLPIGPELRAWLGDRLPSG
jgi:hypothetical protein